MFSPKSTAVHEGIEKTFNIRGTAPLYNDNTIDSPFKTEGEAPCIATSYTENRLTQPGGILTQPKLHKYDIGADGSVDLKFTFDILPFPCRT